VPKIPTAAVAAGSLIGGYVVARQTHIRPLGAVPLAVGGAWCVRQWRAVAGPPTAAALLGVYLGAFGASHPLAKRIGAWPAVLTVAATSGLSSWALADRRR
jgi:hypothetical protein